MTYFEIFELCNFFKIYYNTETFNTNVKIAQNLSKGALSNKKIM